MSEKFIGRKFNLGIGKETVRGTGVAPEYWLPKMELSIDENAEKLINESSVGVISDAEGVDTIHKNSVGELKARVGDTTFGHILLGILGAEDQTPNLVGGETIVYDHEFTVYENAQHPSFTIAVEEPNATGVNGLRYALSSFESMALEIMPAEYANYVLNFRGNAKANATNTPSYPSGQDKIFLPWMANVKFATNLAGLDAASNIEVKKFNINFNKNLEDDRVIGNLGVADRLNRQFSIEGTVEVLYTDRTYIDLNLANTPKAMRLRFVNTDYTIGVSSNPQFTFDFAKVHFTEVAREMSNNDLVKQTLNFKATYSLTDSKIMTATLRNLRATAY